jgi:uroporphyrinogen-III synthase
MRQTGVQLSFKRKNARGKTLENRTFLITRSSEGNAIEKRKLESYGAKVVELPSIEILPPSSWKRLDRALSKLEQFDWVVFTSANGVKMFFERLRQKYPRLLTKLRKRAGGPRFACVGPATRLSLEVQGFRASLQPKEFLTSKLGMELAKSMEIAGKRILLARTEVANKQLSKILRASHAVVIEAPTYRTQIRATKLDSEVLDEVSDITLTSPSTVKGLLKSASSREITSRGIRVHCIGPVTAKSAKTNGLKAVNVARINTIDGLIKTIVQQSRKSLEIK